MELRLLFIFCHNFIYLKFCATLFPLMRIRGTSVEGPLLAPERSYIKKGFGSSCGCPFLIIVILGIALRISFADGEKELHAIPSSLQNIIPYYFKTPPTRITERKAANISRSVATVRAIPQIFLRPFHSIRTLTRQKKSLNAKELLTIIRKDVQYVFTHPGGNDAMDRHIIEWDNTKESMQELRAYYIAELPVYGFTLHSITDNQNKLILAFSGGDGVTGTIEILNYFLNKQGVEKIIFTLNTPTIW